MFELRDYQQEACDKAVEFFESNSKKNPVIVAPTGAGKSIYIADIANRLKTGILVLQPSKELLEQNYAKYIAYGGIASIYSASAKSKEVGHVTFATIGSVVKYPQLFAHVRNIIIDECHLVPPTPSSQYMKFLNALYNVKVLGLTASPIRRKQYSDPYTDENYSQLNVLLHERPKFFNEVLHVTQIKELSDRGYYAKIQYVPIDFNQRRLIANSTGGEYSESSMDIADRENRIEDRIPDIIAMGLKKGRQHCLAFVRSVDQAHRLSEVVPNSAVVTGETKKKEREEILEDFKSGVISTVFNVNVLTTGFDFPELDFVLMSRPTMSLAMYMQIIGRGVRPSPEKEKCVFVDMCGNIKRFGAVEDVHFGLDAAGKKWQLTNKNRPLTGVRMDQI